MQDPISLIPGTPIPQPPHKPRRGGLLLWTGLGSVVLTGVSLLVFRNAWQDLWSDSERAKERALAGSIGITAGFVLALVTIWGPRRWRWLRGGAPVPPPVVLPPQGGEAGATPAQVVSSSPPGGRAGGAFARFAILLTVLGVIALVLLILWGVLAFIGLAFAARGLRGY